MQESSNVQIRMVRAAWYPMKDTDILNNAVRYSATTAKLLLDVVVVVTEQNKEVINRYYAEFEIGI